MSSFLFLLKYSYRNLWRVPKRTLIMVLSLSIGTGFIIWNLTLATSGSKEVMKEFLSQYSGVYHVTHEEYYNRKNFKEFNNYKTLSDAEIKDPQIFEKSSRRVTAPVFISGEKKTLGVLMTGIEVDRELKLSTLHKSVTTGSFLSPLGNKQIIIGKKLSERLGVTIGQEVAVIGQALDGSVANDLLTVVGLLDFGGGDLEESLAFTQFNTAQEFMVMDPERYHQRVSFDVDREDVPKLQGLVATSWNDLLPEISVSIRFIDKFTWIVSVIIVMVISLGLSNTLMITFFEREQEFQSMSIIGAKASWITKSLLIEVFIMGLISVVFGTIIGFILTKISNLYPINILIFTDGKPLIMGGMEIQPLIKLYQVDAYFWQVPLLILFFLGLTMIYPLARVIHRSRHAV
jgi:putative ABC transport system permease protein